MFLDDPLGSLASKRGNTQPTDDDEGFGESIEQDYYDEGATLITDEKLESALNNDPVEHAALVRKLKQTAITKSEVVQESFKETCLREVEDKNVSILRTSP